MNDSRGLISIETADINSFSNSQFFYFNNFIVARKAEFSYRKLSNLETFNRHKNICL